MNRIFFGLIFLRLLYGCSDIDSNKISTKDSSGVNSHQPGNNNIVNHSKIPDFLGLSNNQTTEYKGYLQGVNKNDSSGPYIFKEYYSDSVSFQLFYLPKHQQKSIVTFDSIKKAKDNDYRDYTLIAFVYPMQDPEKAEDYHEDNVKYPVSVKCYAKREKNWEYVSEQIVRDLTEFSQFQIKCIHSTIK